MEPSTDNHKVTPLWEPNRNFPELRRPTLATEMNTNTNNVTDIIMKSKLSVDAKEWYPPGYEPNAAAPALPTGSVQNRLKKYAHNDRAAHDGQSDHRAAPAGSHVDQMDQLNDVIKVLTLNPWKFDHIVMGLIESLEPHFTDVEFISKITSSIFHQALKEPNFQYSGARLCAILDANCPIFRAYLHTLCEKELRQPNNLPVLTLLIAEIYSQMSFELFGKCLTEALQKLLADNSPDNVKYVCQTLKLTGAKLEALDTVTVQHILNKLANFNSHHCPSHLQNLIQSVVTLAKNNWGQEDIQAIPPPSEPSNWSDGPVFYGPDGVEMTSEETEFLTESLEDFIIDDTDPDALWEPEPEMNEEIQAAFAEFVRSSNR